MRIDNPLVSIIIRTKDRPELLINAIRSVACQTYRPIEVVLINDGTITPDLREIKQSLGDIQFNYIKSRSRHGRAAAANLGINRARGDYIAFLDDDDDLYPEHISILKDHLINNPQIAAAYTDSFMVFKEYNDQFKEFITIKKELIYSDDFDFNKLLFVNYIPIICLLFKKEALLSVGGLDHEFDLFEDWDLLIRIAKSHKLEHLKVVTANVNRWDRASQISFIDQPAETCDLLKQAFLQIVAKHFDEYDKDVLFQVVSEKVIREYMRSKARERFWPFALAFKIKNMVRFL